MFLSMLQDGFTQITKGTVRNCMYVNRYSISAASPGTESENVVGFRKHDFVLRTLCNVVIRLGQRPVFRFALLRQMFSEI